MKDKDRVRVSVIRLLQASIKNVQIEKGRDRSLTETDLLEVLVTAAKQRKEAIEQFAKGGREDLVQKEKDELKVLEEFLPPPMGQSELEDKIRETIQVVGAASIRDMGKVMKALMPQIIGRADSGQVSRRVKDLLGGGS